MKTLPLLPAPGPPHAVPGPITTAATLLVPRPPRPVPVIGVPVAPPGAPLLLLMLAHDLWVRQLGRPRAFVLLPDLPGLRDVGHSRLRVLYKPLPPLRICRGPFQHL